MRIFIGDNYININYDISFYNNGEKYSFDNIQKHRVDGPACEFISGGETWWSEDERHREYGPARKWRDSDEWWFEDVRYTQKKFMEKFL